MDWSKAKNVLIVIFLALNIFLLADLYILTKQEGVSKETIANATSILNSKGVVLKCELPTYNGKTSRLAYEGSAYDRSKVLNKLCGYGNIPSKEIKDGKEFVQGSRKLIFESGEVFAYQDASPGEGVNISDRKAVEKYVRKLLKGLELKVREYFADTYIVNPDNSVKIVFIEKLGNFLVYDNKVEVTVTGKGITYLRCSLKKVKGFTPEKNEIIPAYLALLKNYGSSSNMVITAMDIGYGGHALEQDIKEAYEKPVWHVRIENIGDKYFNAYDGQEIK